MARLLVTIGILVGVEGGARGQDAPWVPGQHMTVAVNRTLATAAKGAEQGFGFVEGIAVLGAYLPVSGTIEFGKTLEAGRKYLLLAGGDEDVQDLDLGVLGPDRELVAKDDADDAQPVVLLEPRATGVYTLRVNLYQARESSFVALVLLEQGGWQVPPRNLSTSLAGLIAIGAQADRVRGAAKFHDAPGQWALFGGVIKNDESLQLSAMALEPARHLMTAAGDGVATDLDLYLHDDASDAIQASDEEADATPVIEQATDGGKPSSLRVRHALGSGGPSLVLTAVLDLPEEAR